MGQRANTARWHLEKIDHYHKHAGTAGYSQAKHHYEQLSALRAKAHGSDDAVIIGILIEGAKSLMEEMQTRERKAADSQGA